MADGVRSVLGSLQGVGVLPERELRMALMRDVAASPPERPVEPRFGPGWYSDTPSGAGGAFSEAYWEQHGHPNDGNVDRDVPLP